MGLNKYLSPPPFPWFSLDTSLATHLTYIMDQFVALFACRVSLKSHTSFQYNSAVNCKIQRYRSETDCILYWALRADGYHLLTAGLRYTTATGQASRTVTAGCMFFRQFYNWASWCRMPDQHHDKFNKPPSMASCKVVTACKWMVNTILKLVWQHRHC